MIQHFVQCKLDDSISMDMSLSLPRDVLPRNASEQSLIHIPNGVDGIKEGK